MRTLGWNVLGEFCHKVQRREYLEITLGARLRSVSILVGKGTARLLFGLVDHLPGVGHLDQPRQAEGAADHVLNQTLDTTLGPLPPTTKLIVLDQVDRAVVRGASPAFTSTGSA